MSRPTARPLARRVTLAAAALMCATSGVAGASPTTADVSEAAPAAVPAAAPAAAVEESAVTALVARRAQFASFTLSSPETLDMVGVQPSLYRGRYFRKAIERTRRCIVRRESEGHYHSVNPTGSYRGAYQVSAALARGATWMMLREHRALMGPESASATMATLRATPFNAWPRYWQDALFSTVANWRHTGSGLRHWAGGRWHC